MVPVDFAVTVAATVLVGAFMVLVSHPAMPRYVVELPGRMGRRITRAVRRWSR